MFFRVQSENEATLFEAQAPTMVTLTKGCKSVHVVRELAEIPGGCGSVVLTPTVSAHVLVRGQIDLDAEIGKCEKKLDLARMGLAKVQKVEAHADYASTVPPDVRVINENKVCITCHECLWILTHTVEKDIRGRGRGSRAIERDVRKLEMMWDWDCICFCFLLGERERVSGTWL